MQVGFDLSQALERLGFVISVVDGVEQAVGLDIDDLGGVTIQYHRQINGKKKNEMCVLRTTGPHMDVLFMGVEPRSYEELATLIQLLFPLSSVSKSAQKLFLSKNYAECFDGIQKYLTYARDVYVPIIYKHENEFCDNSVWVMYAKENMNSFSKKKVLFHVKAGTLERGVAKFLSLYDEHCVSKFIVGREWHGTEPYEIDFMND